MKITPLEIRQKSFEKAFRGLDKDEVTAFLATLSTAWEKLLDENKELKIKLVASEREVEKLREVENSLFKTLKTAEDTGANLINQANKTAELHMRETEMKAEAMISDAKNRARDMMEMAETKSKIALDEMESRIRSMAQVYRMLENVRADLLSDIKTFAKEAIEKATRADSQFKSVNIDEELMKIKREIVAEDETKTTAAPRQKQKRAFMDFIPNKQGEYDSWPQKVQKEEENDEKSFFDDL